MGNDASRVAVVDVFLVRAQVGERRGTEAILLQGLVGGTGALHKIDGIMR